MGKTERRELSDSLSSFMGTDPCGRKASKHHLSRRGQFEGELKRQRQFSSDLHFNDGRQEVDGVGRKNKDLGDGEVILVADVDGADGGDAGGTRRQRAV